MDFYKVKFFNSDGTLYSVDYVKTDDVLEFAEYAEYVGTTFVTFRRYHKGLKRSKVVFLSYKTENTVQQILDTKEIIIKLDK